VTTQVNTTFEHFLDVEWSGKGLTFPAKCRCLHSSSIKNAKGVCFIAGILIFIGLFITFSHANAVVKREIAKQSRRSLTSLLLIVCNLLGCILFIYYLFQDQKLYLRYLFVYLIISHAAEM
jgi:hypothetical protein